MDTNITAEWAAEFARIDVNEETAGAAADNAVFDLLDRIKATGGYFFDLGGDVPLTDWLLLEKAYWAHSGAISDDEIVAWFAAPWCDAASARTQHLHGFVDSMMQVCARG